MAKRHKALPARPPTQRAREEHSLLLRSAESLGRVIGALQRQLDDASRKLGVNNRDRRLAATPIAGRPATTAARKNTKGKAKKKAARPPARSAAGKGRSSGTKTKRRGR